jgi:hypothetical protein
LSCSRPLLCAPFAFAALLQRTTHSNTTHRHAGRYSDRTAQ